jgi:Flp pilus assembly protein CpaB
MSSPLKIALGAVVGLVGGSTVAGLVAGFLSYVSVRKQEHQSRTSWPMVDVVVAARDLAPGSVLGENALSARSVPEAMVTASIVTPEKAAYIAHQRLEVPLRAGDPMAWTFFETAYVAPEESDVAAACSAAIDSAPNGPKRERSSADIRARIASGRRP